MTIGISAVTFEHEFGVFYSFVDNTKLILIRNRNLFYNDKI